MDVGEKPKWLIVLLLKIKRRITMDNKSQIIEELLEQLDELMEIDWDEASDFLNNLSDEYWKDNEISIELIEKISEYFY